MSGLTDEQAETLLTAALNLAVVMRDEIGEGVVQAARKLLDAAGGDAIAALGAAAALIRTDAPVERWWQTPEPPLVISMAKLLADNPPPQFAPCGTHAAFNRHKANGQPIDTACRLGERTYQRACKQRYRAASGGGGVAA